MSKKTFEPVTFTVDILNPDKSGFHTVAEYIARSKAEQDKVEREAHMRCAEECEKAWPGLWHYGDETNTDLSRGPYNYQFVWNGWEGIGTYVPAIVREHDPQAIAARNAEARKRRAAEARKRAEIAALPPMEVKDAALWQKCLDNNQDGYGAAVNTYARQWAQLMQVEFRKAEDRYRAESGGVLDKTGSMEKEQFWRGVEIAVIRDCADRTSREADTEGISGFQYGAAVVTLAGVWIHGEALKRWHNGEYGKPHTEGVINPALMSFGSSEEHS